MSLLYHCPSGFESVPCPKCGSSSSRTVIVGRDRLHGIDGEFYVAECQTCGLWYQNPRPTAKLLAGLYPTEYKPHEAPGNQIKGFRPSPSRSQYYRRHLGYTHLTSDSSWDPRSLPLFDVWRHWAVGVALIPRFVPGGHLLEIGCASGAQLLMLRNLGWENLYGIELSPVAAAIAQANGFPVECGLVEDALDDYPDEYFDVIVSSMVLEHLFNPFKTVNHLAKKLKPDGQFLFSTVSRDGLDAMVYGTYWRNLDLPRHMVLFRKIDIRDMLAGQFEHVEMFHQAAPIDFVGSAKYRRRECQKLIDQIVIRLGELRLKHASLMLAWLGLTSRISIRCRKMDAIA